MTRVKGITNIILYFVMQFVIIKLLYMVTSPELIISQLAASGGALVVLVILNYKYIKDKVRDGIKDKEEVLKYTIYGFILMMAVPILLAVVQDALKVGDVSAQNQEIILDLIKNSNPLLVGLAIGIIAPILEELVFRASFMGVFTKDKKTKILVIYVLCALVFALLHDQTIITNTSIDSLFTFLGYFCPALVLCFIYYASNHNLVVVILIHVINNMLPLLLM